MPINQYGDFVCTGARGNVRHEPDFVRCPKHKAKIQHPNGWVEREWREWCQGCVDSCPFCAAPKIPLEAMMASVFKKSRQCGSTIPSFDGLTWRVERNPDGS